MQQKRLPTWFVSSGSKRQQLAQWSPGPSLGLQGTPVILLINNLEHIAELKFGSQELSQALPPQQPYSPHNNLASSAVLVFLNSPVSHCSVIKHSDLHPKSLSLFSSAISAYVPFSSTPLWPFSPSSQWPVHARTGMTRKVHLRGTWLGYLAHLLLTPRFDIIKEFSPRKQKSGFSSIPVPAEAVPFSVWSGCFYYTWPLLLQKSSMLMVHLVSPDYVQPLILLWQLLVQVCCS